ncbi:FAD-dependent oxidoreductase [Acaryochloris marina NIES-2412]|uniref:FAD-dependent oxidoreductase n=1 Tax=Acaryochloris marina TaxID=155978 RepID=UPI004058F379
MRDKSGSDLSRHIYDVLIVGAGPVGLATAVGLRKRGITNILVIDQASEFRRVGQMIDLLPNGLRAIKYADSNAYKKIKETAFKAIQSSDNKKSSSDSTEVKQKPVSPTRRWKQKNLQGEVTLSIPLDFKSWYERYGEGRVSLSWFDLQTTLRSLLPTEIVQANHRCIHIEEADGWVQINTISDAAISVNPFAHWEIMKPKADTSASTQVDQGSDNKSFSAKLVIAADGVNSMVRQLLYDNTDLREWAKPQYSGIAAIGCFRIGEVPDSILEELEAKCFQGETIITLHNDSVQFDTSSLEQLRLVLIRRPDDSMGYLLHAPIGLDSWRNKSPSEIINLGIKKLESAKFPIIYQDLVRLSDPEKLIHRLYYIHPVNIPVNSQISWSHGRVVLVGDAAHAMPPFLAQGANQGFEDAALIATEIAELIHNNSLDDETEIAKVFRKYEKARRPFVEKVQAATMKRTPWNQKEWEDLNEILHRREYSSSVVLG